jgi:hypothetical protein
MGTTKDIREAVRVLKQDGSDTRLRSRPGSHDDRPGKR